MAAVPLRVRRQLSGEGLAGALAAATATVLGSMLAVRHLVPGAAAAVGVSLGLGEIAGHVFGHGLMPWVTLTLAGLFALALDRQL